MGRDWIMEIIGKAPAHFTITPRNADRTIPIGGGHMVFGNVSSPPNYCDLEVGKKVSGTRAHCANLLKLTQYFNCIHFVGGYPVEPVDIHALVRHLNVVFDKFFLTDKAMRVYQFRKRTCRRRDTNGAHCGGANPRRISSQAAYVHEYQFYIAAETRCPDD